MSAIIARFICMMVAALTLLGMPGVAHAVSHTFCFDYNVSFTDAASGDSFTGSTYDAKGATFRIIRNSNSDQYDFTLQTSDGCKTITLNAEPWTVKLLRTASVGGNTVEVRSHIDDGLFVTTVETAWTPSSGGTTTWAIGTAGNINIMAVATYAVYNHSWSGGNTYSFRNGNDPCPTSGGCWDVGTNTINIGSGIWDFKFAIAHELGHAQSDKFNASAGFNQDYTAAPDTCDGVNGGSSDGHFMESKEFQSGAAVEGIAHFYSALVFNDDTEYDCEVEKHYRSDWDQDNTLDAGETYMFSCEGAPISGEAGADYVGNRCLGSGYTNNRGNEFDWLRMFWDLTTDESKSWVDILGLWALANPDDWNATGHGTGADYPAQRMSDVADALLYGAAYDSNASFNGTHR